MFAALLADFLRVRTLLMLLGLLCLAILIWFVGPYVSIAGITPLGSVGARLGAIGAVYGSRSCPSSCASGLAPGNARAIKTLLDSDGLALLASEQSTDEWRSSASAMKARCGVLKEMRSATRPGAIT